MSIGKAVPVLILIATLAGAWSISADAKDKDRSKKVERSVQSVERGNSGKSFRLNRNGSRTSTGESRLGNFRFLNRTQSYDSSGNRSRLGNFRFLSRTKSNRSSRNRGQSKSRLSRQREANTRPVTMKVIQIGDGPNQVRTFLGGTEQQIGSKGVLRSLETEDGGQERHQNYVGLANLTDRLEDLPFPVAQLKEAAEAGDREAQFELATAYERGFIVEKDLAWAARWYGKAAYQGHREGQFHYGRLKLEGIGLPLDKRGAYRWMKLAAEQDHIEAKRTSDDLELRLDIDHLYNERDWVKLFKPSTGVWLSDPPTVEYIQVTLERIGYSSGQSDGFAGDRTIAAIEAFQADQSLEPTGRISEDLLDLVKAKDPGIGDSADTWNNPDQVTESRLN